MPGHWSQEAAARREEADTEVMRITTHEETTSPQDILHAHECDQAQQQLVHEGGGGTRYVPRSAMGAGSPRPPTPAATPPAPGRLTELQELAPRRA